MKSVSSEFEFVPKGLSAKKKGKAYVVGIGINKYDDTSWKPRYAVNDARGFTEDVVNSLRATGRYDDVIPIAVVSDEKQNLKPNDIPATKDNIRKVIAGLARQ